MGIYHLLVVGFDEIVINKYITSINRYIEEGVISSWTLIDLASQKEQIKQRLKGAKIPPSKVIFIGDDDKNNRSKIFQILSCLVDEKLSQGFKCRSYIATEVQYHYFYLDLLTKLGVECLIEKPVLAPVINGNFQPELINTQMSELCTISDKLGLNHSVMTLSRYHSIYNDVYIKDISEASGRYFQPVTSLHLQACGGVWNRMNEYLTRDDHPYKFGYGMLMHGAYHYIDLACQIIRLNLSRFPSSALELELYAYAAFPNDQPNRLSTTFAQELGDFVNSAHKVAMGFGETDVVSLIKVKEVGTNNVIMIGTLSFEQTSPSFRSWAEFPENIYNKNGRNSCVSASVQLGTLFGSSIRVYDVPSKTHLNPDRIDARAVIDSTANASMLKDEEFLSHREFSGLFHSDSNRSLMESWLLCRETRSLLQSHQFPMSIIQGIYQSLRGASSVVIGV